MRWWSAPGTPQRLYFSQLHEPDKWPDDVWCARCGCYQLPDHISADGLAYHTASGEVWQQVAFTYGRGLVVQPWNPG